VLSGPTPHRMALPTDWTNHEPHDVRYVSVKVLVRVSQHGDSIVVATAAALLQERLLASARQPVSSPSRVRSAGKAGSAPAGPVSRAFLDGAMKKPGGLCNSARPVPLDLSLAYSAVSRAADPVLRHSDPASPRGRICLGRLLVPTPRAFVTHG
jgi:hypothetical protein